MVIGNSIGEKHVQLSFQTIPVNMLQIDLITQLTLKFNIFA